MSSKANSKHINIYLSDTDKTDMSKNAAKSHDNMSHQYIILSHDKMRVEYDLMTRDLAILRVRHDELEEESERMEKTITNLKGFVKNIGEMNKLNSQLKKSYSNFQNETRTIAMSNYSTIYWLVCDKVLSLFVLFTMYVMLWFMNCVTFVDITLATVLDILVIGLTMYSFREEFSFIKYSWAAPKLSDTPYKVIHQKYMPVINEKMSELAELEKGNEFLNDLIDLQ